MSSWAPAGNDFTLDRESAIHVRLFSAALYACLAMKASFCQLAAKEGARGGAVRQKVFRLLTSGSLLRTAVVRFAVTR